MPLQAELNRLAGTVGLGVEGAANVWAGTSRLALLGALNAKAGNSNPNTWRGLEGVLNQLAGTSGLGVVSAAKLITNNTVGFRASALANNGETATTASIAFTIPAGAQVGDLAIASFCTNTTADTITPPAGWNLLTASQEGGTAVELWVYWKKLVAGEPGSVVTFTESGVGRNPGIMDVFSGTSNGSPIEAVQGTNSGSLITSVPAPAVTSITPNSWIYSIWAGNDAVTTPETITVPGSHTPLGFSATAFASGANLAIRGGNRTAVATTPGSYGPYNATFGTSARTASFSMVLRP